MMSFLDDKGKQIDLIVVKVDVDELRSNKTFTDHKIIISIVDATILVDYFVINKCFLNLFHQLASHLIIG